MCTVEMTIWSAATGSVGFIVGLALADALYSRSRADLHTLVYLLTYWLFVILRSGLPSAILPEVPVWLYTAQVLVGPLCTAIGSYGTGL